MRERGLPWHEAVSKVEPKSVSLEEGKAWRTREAEAGRPSSYEDFCRVHGLCVTCLGEGLVHNDNGVGFKVVGMDGDIRCSSDARCAAERERSLPCSAFRLNHPQLGSCSKTRSLPDRPQPNHDPANEWFGLLATSHFRVMESGVRSHPLGCPKLDRSAVRKPAPGAKSA